MKPFSLLVFLAVILVREKRVLYIIRDSVLSLLPTLLCKLIYFFGPDKGQSTESLVKKLYLWMIQANIQIGRTEASLCVVVLLVLYAIIYIKDHDPGSLEEFRFMIWGVFAIMAVFSVIVGINPYWITYMAPFFPLALLMSTKNLDFKLFLSLIADCSLIFYMCSVFDWVFGGQTTYAYLLLKRVYENKEDIRSVSTFMGRLGLDIFNTTIAGVLLASMIVICIISYMGIGDRSITEYKAKGIKSFFLMRILILILWSVTCLYLLIR